MSDPIVRARNGDAEFFKRVPVDRILNLRDEEGRSVLSISVRSEHFQCTKVILQRCPSLLYQSSDSGSTALHYAVHGGKLAIVKLLIHGAEKKLFRMRDRPGYAPIMVAVIRHQLEMVKLLIQADPDYVVPPNNEAYTPLTLALYFSDDDITEKIRRLLLEKQPSQCKVRAGTDGRTALHWATLYGNLGGIKELIEFCPDSVFVVDFDGNNFLHTAVEYERVHVVEYIAKEIEIVAALLNSKNKDGDTPLDIATKTGNREIIECLQDAPTTAGYENEREKELCVRPEHLKLYRYLVRNFGEIVPPHLSLSLDEFLCFVIEMLCVTPDTITQQLISFWEQKIGYYNSVGLQVSWLQKHVTRCHDWLAKKNENIRHLEMEITAKEEEIKAKDMELMAANEKKLIPLKDEIAAKRNELLHLQNNIAAKEKELSYLRVALQQQSRNKIEPKQHELSYLRVELQQQQQHLDFRFGLFDK